MVGPLGVLKLNLILLFVLFQTLKPIPSRMDVSQIALAKAGMTTPEAAVLAGPGLREVCETLLTKHDAALSLPSFVKS